MTLCQPTIEVYCDGECGSSIFVELTTTSQGYDERNVEADILFQDWVIDGDNHYCCDCDKQRKRDQHPGTNAWDQNDG